MSDLGGRQPGNTRVVRGGGGRTLAFVIMAMMAGYLLAGWGRSWFRDRGEVERQFEVMNTYGRIRVPADDRLEESPAVLAERAEAVIRRVSELMGPVGEGSDVVRLNRSKPGEWVEVDPLTWRVVMEALRWHRLSGGAFDPTIGPVKRLFRFDQSEVNVWPSEAALEAARGRVGGEKLLYDREGMRLSWAVEGMGLDLGAIAKGFAADLAMEVLVGGGVKRGLVDIGGELRLLGDRGDGSGGGWRAGVKSPRGDEIVERLELFGGGVATSGDYERYFTYKGERFEHIIDPRVGLPMREGEGPASVTVIHPDSCMVADALATTMCVLGVRGGREFIEGQALGLFFGGGVRVIMIVGDGKEGWRRVEIRVVGGEVEFSDEALDLQNPAGAAGQ